MPRRKNPVATLVLLVFVLAFGWAAYHFVYEGRIFEEKQAAAVPQDQVERVRRTVDEGLASEDGYQGITALNWRQQAKRYRVDVTLHEGCTVADAKRMAGRVNELVMRSTEGSPAESWFYVLGRELYHYVP